MVTEQSKLIDREEDEIGQRVEPKALFLIATVLQKNESQLNKNPQKGEKKIKCIMYAMHCASRIEDEIEAGSE